jgi:hypothetical protein
VAAPAASATGPTTAGQRLDRALDGGWTDQIDDAADTPIFRSVRSAWLSGGGPTPPWVNSEVEAGWERADRVAAAETVRTAAGLPQRRPGAHLVPGGVSKSTGSVARDPEAVRDRLAAYAAGVSAGRRVATGGTEHHDPTEAGSS